MQLKGKVKHYAYEKAHVNTLKRDLSRTDNEMGHHN